MAKKKIEDTQPQPIPEAPADPPQEPIQDSEVPAEPRKKQKVGRWILLGILILVVMVALSSVLAYFSGINARKSSETQTRLTKAAEHYQYGVQMMDQQKYDLATVQFAYVIQLDPNFPGVIEKMTDAQMKAIAAQQPTVAPTAMVTATPDTRGVDDLFANAQQNIANSVWEQAYQDLQSLRNADLNYKVAEVDQMYYVVLRNLGVQKIFGSQQNNVSGGQLEEGIYFLYLASKFAPIDKEAYAAGEWAKRYITATSKWGVDWQSVVDRLQVIYQSYPYMVDINGKTAFARYAMALAYLGMQLESQGDPCTAVARYQDASAVFQQYNRTPPDDIGDLMARITEATNKCNAPEPTEKPTKTPKVEETTEAPTDVPVEDTATPEPAAPTETPSS